MKTFTTTKYAQSSNLGLSPINQQPIRQPWKLVDDKGQVRGQVTLSDLEAEVMNKVLAKGDLMVAKFKLQR